MFSGNRGTLTILQDSGDFFTCKALGDARLCQGGFVSSQSHELGAHWIHEDTLRIATSFETDGVYVVEIRELRPTSNPPLHLLASFPAPPHNSGFSFSPASYHASFIIGIEAVVLGVRESKVLLRTEVAQAHPTQPGRFSPDGRFFACRTSEHEIRVWQKTPTGYIPWSNLRSRLPFKGFSFSPTTPSVLTWGPEGIQLLYPDDRLSPPSRDGGGPDYELQDHLVTYSAGRAQIATARKEDSIITVLDSLSGTLRRSINTNMEIREIGTVDNAIFVANGSELAWWDLETGGRVYGTHAAREAVMVIDPLPQRLAFSHDYSHIAFSGEETVSLYDVNAQKTITHALFGGVFDIRFSPQRPGLRVLTEGPPPIPEQLPALALLYYLMELDLVEGGGFGKVTYDILEDPRSWVDLFSRGCRIWSGSGQWVVDPRGSKLLWLPPSWRVKSWNDARWDGDFLALLDARHELPIIIEFRQTH